MFFYAGDVRVTGALQAKLSGGVEEGEPNIHWEGSIVCAEAP